jgi:hypothetical protein
MKLFNLALACIIALVSFALFSTSITSCTKTTTIHDTTTVVVKDTITSTVTVRDTVILNDTIYNLTSGLIGYYNFNGGNLNDSSGYNNNIVFNNATLTTDRFGNANSAYSFDGTSSYMRVKNNISLNPNNISLFAIVKPNGFNTATCHVSQILGKLSQDPENGIYCLRLNDSIANCTPTPLLDYERFYGTYGDNNNPYGSATEAGLHSSPNVQLGQWYTLAFTFDGTTAKFYINGTLTDSSTKTILFSANSDDLYFGATPNPSFYYYFNGVIDEIRIYNNAITPMQVNALNMLKTKYLKMNNKLVY